MFFKVSVILSTEGGCVCLVPVPLMVCMPGPKPLPEGGRYTRWMGILRVEVPGLGVGDSVAFVPERGVGLYRSRTVNSKSFVGKVLLLIKWKFELTVYFKHEMLGK